MPSVADMFACRVCANLYLTEQEADLCTPAAGFDIRYPSGVVIR